jgi:tetratricopeptide (TPR) repeat protein
MRAQALSGDVEGAWETYTALRRRLARELQTTPAPATEAVARQLRTERRQTAPSLQQLPLVGRVRERRALLTHLAQSEKGHGTLQIVLGPSGMGKTRLLESVAQSARWRGWHVVWGEASVQSFPAPFAPLTTALLAALSGPRAEQLRELVPAVELAQAAALLPPLEAVCDPQLQPEQAPGVPQLARTLAAIGRGLTTIGPHLFLLDDMQWADPAVWPLLQALKPLMEGMPWFILMAGRDDTLRQQAAARDVVAAWDEDPQAVVALPSLSQEEVGALLRAAVSEEVSSEQIAQLWAQGGGNPLLTLSQLQDTIETIPRTVNEAAATRFKQLAPEAQMALQAAAVLGNHFAYGTWRRMVPEIAAPALAETAGELERAQILAPAGSHYRFTHDSLHSAAYESLPEERRARLHRRALEMTGEDAPAETRLHHATGAGDRRAIAGAAVAAGHAALTAGAYALAVDYFRRALDAAVEEKNAWAARLALTEALHVLARREEEGEQIERLLATADDERRPQALLRAAIFHNALGELDAADDAARQGLALTRELEAWPVAADFSRILGVNARTRGEIADAENHARRARTFYQRAGQALGVAKATDQLGGIAWVRGDLAAAIRRHGSAATQFRQLGHRQYEAQALNNLGSAQWSAGAYAEAQKALEAAEELNRAIGHRRGQADNLDNLGGIDWARGAYREAIRLYQQALSIRKSIGDRWGMAISHSNLGSAYRLLGDTAVALEHFSVAQALNRELGRRRGLGYNLHGRGLTHLEAGECAAAEAALRQALALRQDLGEPANAADTAAALLLWAVRCAGEAEVSRLQQLLADTLRTLSRPTARLRQWCGYVRLLAARRQEEETAARAAAAEALQALWEATHRLPAEERGSFLARVPLNRQTLAVGADYCARETVTVRAAGAPDRGPRSTADTVSVTWTVRAPDDELIGAGAARRRYVLRRLLAEADIQGGHATTGELAAALGVSRRTVLRDLQDLSAE